MEAPGEHTDEETKHSGGQIYAGEGDGEGHRAVADAIAGTEVFRSLPTMNQ